MNALLPITDLSRAVPQTERAFAWVPDLLAFLSRRYRLVLCSVAVCVAACLALLPFAPARYTASATILIDPSHSDVLGHDAPLPDAQVLNARIESDVEVLRSEGLAHQVVHRLGFTGDLARQAPLARCCAEIAETQASEALLRMLNIRRVGMTYVIAIDATASSANEAARIANAVVAAYMASELDANRKTFGEAGGWLQDRLRDLRQQALDADRTVQAFKASHGIIETDRGSVNEQQLDELNSLVVAATSREAEAKARLDRITSIIASGKPADAIVVDGLHDAVITNLRERYFDDARQEAEWSAKYGSGHEVAVRLRREMAEIQSSIAAELAHIAQASRSDYDVAAAERRSAETSLADTVRHTQALSQASVLLRSLKSNAVTYQTLYDTFLHDYTQTAQHISFPVAEARIVSNASPPLHKSAPRRKLLLAGSILLGLVAGLGVAALLEIVQSGPHTARDVREALGLDCLAVLPRHRASGIPGRSYSVALRRLRSRLIDRLGDRGSNVIGILASRTDQDTTLMTTELARCLEEAGYATLVLGEADCLDPQRLEHDRRLYRFILVELTALDDVPVSGRAEQIDFHLVVLRWGRVDAPRVRDLLQDRRIDETRVATVLDNVDPKRLT